MKNITLLSLVTSTLIFAGGDIDPVEPTVSIPTVAAVETIAGQIPMSFALLAGALKGEGENTKWNTLYGAEFAFKCLFAEDIRSQLQFTYYDNDNIKLLQLSANPHYIFNRGALIEVGAGPHIGVAQVEVADASETIFTYGAGVSLRSDITENFFIGAEARYEWTTDATFYGMSDNLNNTKVFGKIGFNF